MKRKTKDGEWIEVKEMKTSHIKNCVKKLHDIFTHYYKVQGENGIYEPNCRVDYDSISRWKKIFAVELIRRGEFDFIIDEML